MQKRASSSKKRKTSIQRRLSEKAILKQPTNDQEDWASLPTNTIQEIAAPKYSDPCDEVVESLDWMPIATTQTACTAFSSEYLPIYKYYDYSTDLTVY